MKAVKIIAALLAALLTGCSVKVTVGTQDENQPAETAKQVVTVEDIGALVSELQNGHVWMACAESELYSLRIDRQRPYHNHLRKAGRQHRKAGTQQHVHGRCGRRAYNRRQRQYGA